MQNTPNIDKNTVNFFDTYKYSYIYYKLIGKIVNEKVMYEYLYKSQSQRKVKVSVSSDVRGAANLFQFYVSRLRTVLLQQLEHVESERLVDQAARVFRKLEQLWAHTHLWSSKFNMVDW